MNFSNKPILTDDLSMDGQKNVHIIDYLDHDDYNKTPFLNSYLYVIPFDSHSVPEDLGALTVTVFVPQDKTDVLLNEMEVHFSKYAETNQWKCYLQFVMIPTTNWAMKFETCSTVTTCRCKYITYSSYLVF